MSALKFGLFGCLVWLTLATLIFVPPTTNARFLDFERHKWRSSHMKHCNTDRDCPVFEHLECKEFNSQCMCTHSFKFDQQLQKCVHNVLSCTDDTKCIEENTECHGNRCLCKIGYVRSMASDSCIKVSPNSNFSFLAQNIFTIVIIINFLLWLCIFIFVLHFIKKRRLAMAANVLVEQNTGRRWLPPGMPPPPPAYHNIAFNRSDNLINYPPPPYTPNADPNKTVATTTSPADGPTQPSVAIISVPSNAHMQEPIVAS